VTSGATPGVRFADLVPALKAALRRASLAGMVPVLVFYGLLKTSGPAAGIAGGMAISLSLLAYRFHQARRFDPIVLVPMIIILAQGSVALALNSVELYLAAPAVENLVWGLALIGSVLLGRPLVHLIAGELELIPPDYRQSPVVRRALRLMTLAWSLAAFAKAGARFWLLTWLPLEPFLVSISLFHLALNASLLALSFWWTLRALRRAGWAEPLPRTVQEPAAGGEAVGVAEPLPSSA
jgi:intracellular septation protein A